MENQPELIKLNRVTHTMLPDTLKAIFDADACVMLLANTGVGKTYGVELYGRQEAARQGRTYVDWADVDEEMAKQLLTDQDLREKTYLIAFYDVLASNPEDMKGIGVPNRELKVMEWYPQKLIRIFSLPGIAGLFFMDEVLQGRVEVQKTFAEAYLRGRCGDVRLQPTVKRVAASNRPEDKCAVTRLPEHHKNRLSFHELIQPTAQEWCLWAELNEIDPRIVVLMRSCPDLIYQELADRREDAFCTHRSWHISSDIVKPIDHVRQKDLFITLIAGRVGSGAAAKFQAVLNHDMSRRGPAILQDPTLYAACPWDQKVAFSLWLSGTSKENNQVLSQGLNFLNEVEDNDLLDTQLYMLRTQVGTPFIRAVTGTTRYQKLRDMLIGIAKDIGGLAE